MPEHDYARYAERDLKRSAAAHQNETQSRTTGMFMESSDFDSYDEIDRFTQMASNPKGTRAHRLAMMHKHKKS